MTDINIERLFKIREAKRRLLSKQLVGLSPEDKIRAIMKIDITTCLACDVIFVSDDKTKIRRCNKCGPGKCTPFEMDVNTTFSQSTKRSPGM